MGAAKKVALGGPAGGVPGKRGLGHGREEGFKEEAGPGGGLASVCLGNSGRGQDGGRKSRPGAASDVGWPIPREEPAGEAEPCDDLVLVQRPGVGELGWDGR